jgi:hypothetical protein
MQTIFDMWPTTAELASDLGIPYTTVASWRARGSIPAKHDLDLIAAAAARGPELKLETLAELRRAQAQQGAA